jgi:glycosyltransferase involved in cell wall biosynthesis
MSAQIDVSPARTQESERARKRVLLVPDSIHWITGTIARAIVAHNDWIDGTIISGPVLDMIVREDPAFFASFDLVHFLCPYASKRWLPILHDRLPCVTSHHHVSDDYELQRHNLDGDAIIVGSSQWARDVEARGAPAEKVVRVPYGVDASRFAPSSVETRSAIRDALGIKPDAIVVGFFAKLSSNERDRKGTDIFAAAARALSGQLHNLTILIIGPGWDDLVAELSLAGVNCVWLPFVKESARMPRMYQALDFYWVTARIEGGPVTLLEAMSTAVCCLTTAVGLARDIVESGVNGVIVPFDDAQAFVGQTLAYTAQVEARFQMGAHARQTILETMDTPITSQGVGEAYDVALSQFAARAGSNHAAVPCGAPMSRAVLDRVAILEDLAWAEALMLQGQRALALRILCETWIRNPFSSLPPRYLLRNLLPQRLVRTIVRVKSSTGAGRKDRGNGR